MNLDKAIELLNLDLTYTYPARYDDLQAAINLGSEALKELQALRDTTLWGEWKPLPGETKE